MAKMLPIQYDISTVSAAEKRIFEILKSDPGTKDWIVLHSLGLSRRGTKPYGEIDFVVLIPHKGVLCLEVKGGRIACREGRWETIDRLGNTILLNRSPFLQAREGMFALRETILKSGLPDLAKKTVIGSAVVMPDIEFNVQSLEWEPWQVVDEQKLKKPISDVLTCIIRKYCELFSKSQAEELTMDSMSKLAQYLRPDFEIFVTKGTQINETESLLLRLTEEQFNVLDLLSDNDRCMFEGSAGTGKTILALEYAKRSAECGNRTLFICYNKLLGDWLERRVNEFRLGNWLTAGRYYKTLRNVIMNSAIAAEFERLEKNGQTNELYEQSYPLYGILALEDRNEKYDVLVMDEAQDLLRPHILQVINVWIEGGLTNGKWAIFGDFYRQAIYNALEGEQLKELINKNVTKYAIGRLTMNCRNTRNIGEETALLSGFDSIPYKMGQIIGLPVDYHYYDVREEQKLILFETISKMLANDIKHDDIIVLSRYRLCNSGIAGLDGGKMFKLAEANDLILPDSRIPSIRFYTIQAFKGMESPVVILCDVDQMSDGEPQSLLYTAMSRARSQLTVLTSSTIRHSVVEMLRKRLLDGWRR